MNALQNHPNAAISNEVNLFYARVSILMSLLKTYPAKHTTLPCNHKAMLESNESSTD